MRGPTPFTRRKASQYASEVCDNSFSRRGAALYFSHPEVRL